MNRYLGHCFAALLSPMKRNGGEVQPFSHADLVTSVCPVRNLLTFWTVGFVDC